MSANNSNLINYPKLVDNAMRGIVRKALNLVDANNPLGEYHFLISFITNFPGVTLSPRIKQKYPEEMTIVLQYQFESLKVFEENFSVTLSFDGIKEQVTIPFDALTSFIDPDTKFALQFNPALVDRSVSSTEVKTASPKSIESAAKEINKKLKKNSKSTEVSGEPKVIVLDHFRKKSNK